MWHVFKDPIDGSKKSKSGKLKLIHNNGTYLTVNEKDVPDYEDKLITVFENGSIIKKWSFDEIRKRASI